MSSTSRWIRLSLALATIALSLVACFRDTSEAFLEQPVAREYPSPTVVVEEEPTLLPATDVPDPTISEPVIDQFALTATALIARQTQPVAGQDTSSDDALGESTGAGPATAAPVVRATIPPGEDCVHEIRAGDTLFQLSLAYGVTVDVISAASGIDNPDRIAVGQQVTIPDCGTTGFIPPPTSLPTATFEAVVIPPTSVPGEIDLASSEDTRSALVEQAQESLLDNAESNALEVFSAQLSGEATPSQTYTVQQNDTLFEIASRFGTTVEVLAALNDIDDVDTLSVGDVLQIP